MSRSTAGQVGLESYLKDEGYRLYWGSVDKKEEYLHFDDYELIEWKDDKGQNWILSNSPRGDLPLMTRFSSKEIETRKKERKQEH